MHPCPDSDMKNDKNDKMSISEMLQKIREQVENQAPAEEKKQEDSIGAPAEASDAQLSFFADEAEAAEDAVTATDGEGAEALLASEVQEPADEADLPAETAAEVDEADEINKTDETEDAEEDEFSVFFDAPAVTSGAEKTAEAAEVEDPMAEDAEESLSDLFVLPDVQDEGDGGEEEEEEIPSSEAPEEQAEPISVPASTRYRFRVSKKKETASTAPAEAKESPLLTEGGADAQEGDTAETAAVTVLDASGEEAADLMNADTRPMDPIASMGETKATTMEFSKVERPKDADTALNLWLTVEEAEEYVPHGAEAQMQDTGDITYVFDGKTGEEELPYEEELVPPEVDETDVNLMIAFGMDDELAKTIDSGRRDQVEREISEMEQKLEERGPRFEYTSAQQNKKIFAEYKKKYRAVTVKIAIAALLLLISFLYENISAFGGTLADAINPAMFPVTHVMIDLQLVLFGGALIWRQLKDGLVRLVTLKPTPSSLISALFAITVAYDIGMCFLPLGFDIRLYGFPMLLGITLSLVFALFDLRREIFSFNIVASKRIKFTIGRLDAEGAALEQEAFREFLPDDPNIFKLNKASFIDGFYDKMRPTEDKSRMLTILIFFSIAIALTMTALGAVWSESFASGVTIGYATLMLGMPLAALLTYSFPFYRASQIAYEQDSAILGERAVEEYAEASSISFEDRDVFPSYGVKVRSIKVFGNNRIDTIIYHAASVFRITGGPLSDVFDIATAELGHSEDVRLLSVDTDGIEAVVSGTHLYFGKDEYLRRNRFTPLVDDDDGKVGNASIMYMVSDDEVVAKMYISYRIDPDFEKTLKQLYKYGICVGIKTLDPNIDDEMLSRRIKLDKYPVRILKCREAEDNTKVLEHTDSALVSKHSAKALLKAFTLCAKVQRQIRTDVTLNIIAMLVGTLIMLVTLAFGGAAQIPSFYVALYQLFWAIPMALMANVSIQ